MQLHWLFLSLYNQTQSGCDRMSFTHSVAAFFAFIDSISNENSDSIRLNRVAVLLIIYYVFVFYQILMDL